MSRWGRSAAVPAFLILCMLLGGSRQGIWTNAALQLLALLLLAWAALAPRTDEPTRASRQLLAIAALGVAIVVLQLVPLPPDLWSSLPGRDAAVAGYALLGYELPWLPLSLSPYDTLDAAYALLPPLAVLALLLTSRAEKESWIAAAIVAGALANVVLGTLQLATGGSAATSWAYLHEFNNTGAVGFFANRNHMATLLLAAIPFAGALFASGHPQAKNRGKAFAMLALGGGGFLLVVAGLLLNDSLAALALAVPVIALTALILPAGWRFRRLIVPAAAVAMAGALFALGNSSIRSELVDATTPGSEVARERIWDVTLDAIGETFPAGSGVGTFPHVYAMHEDPTSIERSYTNHAHNDYLELVLETGLAGSILLLLFLAWWGWHSLRVWRSPFSSHFAKAATVASAAVLAHSIVDYPLRTAAIAALFAACLGMIARGQAPAQRRSDEPRHVKIG
jgi:O-antigen ligase